MQSTNSNTATATAAAATSGTTNKPDTKTLHEVQEGTTYAKRLHAPPDRSTARRCQRPA